MQLSKAPTEVLKMQRAQESGTRIKQREKHNFSLSRETTVTSRTLLLATLHIQNPQPTIRTQNVTNSPRQTNTSSVRNRANFDVPVQIETSSREPNNFICRRSRGVYHLGDCMHASNSTPSKCRNANVPTSTQFQNKPNTSILT